MATTSTAPNAATVSGRGVKILGEAVITPGSSLLLDGEIGKGSAHVVGGLAAAYLIGPIGWMLVAANSYSNSVAGDSLWSQLTTKKSDSTDADATKSNVKKP